MRFGTNSTPPDSNPASVLRCGAPLSRYSPKTPRNGLQKFRKWAHSETDLKFEQSDPKLVEKHTRLDFFKFENFGSKKLKKGAFAGKVRPVRPNRWRQSIRRVRLPPSAYVSRENRTENFWPQKNHKGLVHVFWRFFEPPKKSR